MTVDKSSENGSRQPDGRENTEKKDVSTWGNVDKLINKKQN